MLGQHPELYAFPELNLFTTDTIAQLLHMDAAAGSTGHYSGGLLRAVAELESGCQNTTTIAEAERWLAGRGHWSTATMLQFLTARVVPKIAVDKSPRTALAFTSCQRAVSFCHDTRILHLTRHPATTIRSLSATVITRNPDSSRAFAYLWLHAQNNIVRTTATLPDSSSLRIKAEDILLDTRPALEKVMDWLGLPCTQPIIDNMLHPERSPYARPLPACWGFDNDSGFLASPVLRGIAPSAADHDLGTLNLGSVLARQVADMAHCLDYV